MTINKFFINIAAFTASALLLVSCVSVSKINNADYDAFRESRPTSILVLPPLNNSVEVDAPNVILASTVRPLAESGYYIIPVALSNQMFRQNGIQTAADAHAVSHARLREIYDADAALYITITQFGAAFQVLRSVVQVRASAKLVDLRNGRLLWEREIYYEEEPSQTTANVGGGLGGAILAAVATAAVDQIANTLSNAAYNAGRNAMGAFLDANRSDGILFGPYNPKYESD